MVTAEIFAGITSLYFLIPGLFVTLFIYSRARFHSQENGAALVLVHFFLFFIICE